MPENVIEQISSDLRRTAAELYPNHGELKNVRLVGHTPKPEHYIYDIVIDFADGSERVAAKVYRNGKRALTRRPKPRLKTTTCAPSIRPLKKGSSQGCHGR